TKRDWSSDVCSSDLGPTGVCHWSGLGGRRTGCVHGEVIDEQSCRSSAASMGPPASCSRRPRGPQRSSPGCAHPHFENAPGKVEDRKSTRLNSSHVSISYAVFCLKKK